MIAQANAQRAMQENSNEIIVADLLNASYARYVDSSENAKYANALHPLELLTSKSLRDEPSPELCLQKIFFQTKIANIIANARASPINILKFV